MSGELGLQSLSFAAQAHVYKMEFVARIVSTITQVNNYKTITFWKYLYIF